MLVKYNNGCVVESEIWPTDGRLSPHHTNYHRMIGSIQIVRLCHL